METITLQELTRENWVECARLSVRDDQKNFVAPNVFSIAEAHFYPELMPLAIYAGSTMVGFTMFGHDVDTNQYWIIRLMVDQRYQGRGYGRAAMVEAIARIRGMPGCDKIYISYEPENIGAEMLYNSLGFVPTGAYNEGEKVSCLDLTGVQAD